GARGADRAVLFFLIGPVSFFFATIYSEATFVFCAVASLLAARKQRWMLAGVCGALAALTRSVGVLLIVPLALEYVQSRPSRQAWRSPHTWLGLAPCMLPVAGLLAYMAYLGWRFDEPAAYFVSQRHGGHGYSYITDTFISRHFDGLSTFHRWWFGGAVVVGLALLLSGSLLRLPLSLTAFALACCVLYFSIKTLECMPRYLSVVFPFYCTLGLIGVRWPVAGTALLGLSAALAMMSVTLFVNGYWFT
ncbi:MAG TPA: glycosyltransferase family 39 protein, partial [Opitutaceae bacterium]|nr:glycosyltransferase family 39 protein [Opitutaceae bacterium]